MISPIEIIGFSGMSLILLGFVMNQTKRWKDDDLIYDGVNAVGGFLLIIYSVLIGSYPFLGLNLVWTVVSVRDVFFDTGFFKKPDKPGKRRKMKR